MILQMSDVLGRVEAENIRAKLIAETEAFVSGKLTAGFHAKAVKNNEQSDGPAAKEAIALAQQALQKHTVFASAARPKAFVKMLVSRYKPGMAYGKHVDDAIMAGWRTDMSFTLFLSDPASYDGGELFIEGMDGDTEVKLPPGSLVLYPTNALHEVKEVTRGERLAIVGWVRSYIRSPEQRETLFELDQMVSEVAQSGAPRAVADKLFKLRNTLTRMWAED
jgi:PKHD-type hydroxylase